MSIHYYVICLHDGTYQVFDNWKKEIVAYDIKSRKVAHEIKNMYENQSLVS